jgi:hypothetical protein
MKEFRGTPLLGAYEVDDEGVRARPVTLVEDGVLKNLLMSRRPGADFSGSNGHGRASFSTDARPALSNLFVESKQGLAPEELRRKFLEACRSEGREWCLVVKQMDNPALGLLRQEDFAELAMGGAGSGGDRIPLLVCRVYAADGREELIRGSRIASLNLRAMRRVAGVGSDLTPVAFFQSPAGSFGGAAFGSVQNGLPGTVIAPSLLFEEVEVRGARGEPRRPPLVPAPPLE